MNEAAAREDLQTIRTLMERAAIYRRALAPMMLAAGALGVVAAAVGWSVPLAGAPGFFALWVGTSVVVVGISSALIRREAIGAAEPFWTPPTRRVAQAVLPVVVAGVTITVLFLRSGSGDERWIATAVPPVWMVCHGLGLHAAGFFMPRGIRWFGWGFVTLGGLLVLAGPILPAALASFQGAHLVMGAAFGFGHLAYGLYLKATEKGASE